MNRGQHRWWQPQPKLRHEATQLVTEAQQAVKVAESAVVDLADDVAVSARRAADQIDAVGAVITLAAVCVAAAALVIAANAVVRRYPAGLLGVAL